MSKCNSLLYAAVVGFGLAAGIHIYVAWSSLLELLWGVVRGYLTHA